jgi:signal peptidase complex subunit 3
VLGPPSQLSSYALDLALPHADKMHSALVRLQNVFGFFTTVAFTVAAVIALSSFVSPQNPTADIQLRNVQVVKGRPHYYSYKREEYAHIKFDLDTGTS